MGTAAYPLGSIERYVNLTFDQQNLEHFHDLRIPGIRFMLLSSENGIEFLDLFRQFPY